MRVERQVSINYDSVFQGEIRPPIPNLLATIPSKNTLEILGHFSAQIHTRERDSERQVRLLQMWKRLPEVYKVRLDGLVTEIRSEPNAKFTFITNISILILEQYALKYYNELPRLDDLTPEQELNFLKVYLLCTDEWTRKQVYRGENGSTPEGLAKL